MQATKKEVKNQVWDVNEWLKKRVTRYLSLKKIELSGAVYGRISSYRLYSLRKPAYDLTSREANRVK